MNGPSNIEEMSDENKMHHLKKALNVQPNQHEDCWEDHGTVAWSSCGKLVKRTHFDI